MKPTGFSIRKRPQRSPFHHNGLKHTHTLYGTPWDGKHHLSRNASAPLKAIVKMERDTVNHIEPLGKADAFQVLMKQAFCSRKPATMARILELEKKLPDRVAFYTMGCNMEPEAARVAWKGMQPK